jgi:hypothetical protein
MTMRKELYGWLSPLVALAAALVPAGAVRAEDWRYIVPPAGDPMENPPPRALVLHERKPDDLKEEVAYRGVRRRYAQIRYGSPRSIEVAIVVDDLGSGDADLYVDAGRNRVIEAKDRAKRQRGTWRVPLDVAVLEGNLLTTQPRELIFRLGRLSGTLAYATCGYLEGTAELGGKRVAVRRVDGDGNGLFADPQDRLWIDLNGDGAWDPLHEQFLVTPVLQVGGERYRVLSDPLGNRLAFAPLLGTGTVHLAVAAPMAARIMDLNVTLAGRDGSAAALHGNDSDAELPVGEYRVSVVSVSLRDPMGGEPWNFVFSFSGDDEKATWYTLTRGGTQRIDPLGRLELRSGIPPDAHCQAGEDFGFRPELYTGDGLLINTAYRGMLSQGFAYGGCGADVFLLDDGGRELAKAHSGFA